MSKALAKLALVSMSLGMDYPYKMELPKEEKEKVKSPKKEYARIEPYQHRSTKLTKRKREDLKKYE